MSDGGYRGNPEIIMPYRKRRKDEPLPDWQEALNTIHRRVRARVEHALCQMRGWAILRNCRRTGQGVYYATSAVAHMRNLAILY
jgi:hypothetical protein